MLSLVEAFMGFFSRIEREDGSFLAVSRLKTIVASLQSTRTY